MENGCVENVGFKWRKTGVCAWCLQIPFAVPKLAYPESPELLNLGKTKFT